MAIIPYLAPLPAQVVVAAVHIALLVVKPAVLAVVVREFCQKRLPGLVILRPHRRHKAMREVMVLHRVAARLMAAAVAVEHLPQELLAQILPQGRVAQEQPHLFLVQA